MVSRFKFRFALDFFASIATMALIFPALALTREEMIAQCIQAARAPVIACMSKAGATLDSCRTSVGRPFAFACVRRLEQQQAAHVPPPPAPKDETAVAPKDVRPGQGVFMAPPRTIADITAILDQEKPDEAKIAERKAAADAAPPANASPAKLAQFYYDRMQARAHLARDEEAIADGLHALGNRGGDDVLVSRIQQTIGMQYLVLGDPKQAISAFEAIVHLGQRLGNDGYLIHAFDVIAVALISMGDINQASTYAGRVQALVHEARGSVAPVWRSAYAIYGRAWEADADNAQALIFEARGQYAEAEAAYRRADAFARALAKEHWNAATHPLTPEYPLLIANRDRLSIARIEARQGRLPEAEADARRALLEILKQESKYSPATPHFIVGLAGILVEQGRYHEAEKLARTALDVERTLGIGDDSAESARILSQLGNILIMQGKMTQAANVYADLDKAIAQWTPQRREVFELNGSRISALYASGQLEAGVAAAEDMVKRQTVRTGEKSFDAAVARGVLAIGYALAGRDADAIREFKAAIPVMMAAARENADEDDPTLVAARNVRLQRIVEFYIGVLARGKETSGDAAVETFALADAIRGHAVQQALADASARAVAKDPALAQLVRTEQDDAKKINAELGALNNLLALPSSQRDDQTVQGVKAAIEKLRADRKAARLEINRRFPSYADLVDPRPPSVDAIKATLRPGEAMLSFYFGENGSFVWAVPKDGAVAFASVPVKAIDLAAKVHRLRQALEPQITRVSEIPPFDLALAYELYRSLLKPVEAAWQPAKSLIVVTNGALGELPLGLLPTAPAQVDEQAKPMFAGYRDVAWLARTHAVTVVPSASALVTLRHLPRGSPTREPLIGFGDPYFNKAEAAEAEAEPAADTPQVVTVAEESDQAVTRGPPFRRRASVRTEDVDAAQLAMLPRLPETRSELTAMAKALNVDPAKVLYFGKAANEQNVETMDLARYRIVAFATHGLVPGDLDGLTQPALALTAPQVAGVKGDGLLTMEKILALKLDADWVVLSACNTAAGAGAGAEAASGLGSAFFYAGTRALLVTNWSVDSASASALTAETFRRQAAVPALSRAEALRQSMMALLDGPGAVDGSGKTVFTYAHPLFWAPYSVIGDGGGS
jgi:CHAT domain-containing protein